MADPIPFTRKERLGVGAAGEVWLASGEAGDVALKLATGDRGLSAEIGALGRVNHPNVPALLAADRGATWLVRVYVAGARLTSWAHGRPLEERLRVFGKLAQAVQGIHSAGVIHGDLSPANILVDSSSEPQVLDVGADTRGGALGWMAPERFRGDPASVASDVYGLGALLYALLTGRPPYERAGGAQLGYAAAASLPLPPSSHVPDLPTALEEIALACLAWSPGARPRHAADVAAAVVSARADVVRRPLVGMLEERERLRRMVVDTLRGEPGFVILHGPRGCGRAALAQEAARASRREGLRVREVPLASARQALVLARERDALVIDAEGVALPDLLDGLAPRTDAGLVLVRASTPARALSRRGAVHLRPAALDPDDLLVLGEALGATPAAAADAATRSQGRPGVFLDLIAGVVPPGPELDAVQDRLLDRLERAEARLPELAELVDLPETAVLDRLEPLMERGLVWSNAAGDALYGARAPTGAASPAR